MTNNSDNSKVEFATELFRNVEEEAQRSFEISFTHDKLDALNMDEEAEHLGKLTDVCNALQNTARQLNEHAARLNKIFEHWSQAVGA